MKRRQLLRVPLAGLPLLIIVAPVGITSAASSPSENPAPPPAVSGQQPSLTPETVTAGTVMAEVNGVTITFGELEKMVREEIPNVTGHGTISPGRLRQRAYELLDQMITDDLIIQEAARLHITVDHKRVDTEMAAQRRRFPTEAAYQSALTKRQSTEALFRQRVERAVLIQQVIDHEVNDKVTVTDGDLAAYYRDHTDKFNIPRQFRLRLLLVSVDPSATPDEWNQAEKRAREYRNRGLKGEDFGALARQFSGDADTKHNGGDTGWIHYGQLGLPDVEHAVDHLKPGQITEPVRTIYGFYLAKVEGTRPARQQTFEELNKVLFRQELMEAKRREKLRSWITALWSRAKITRVPPPATTP
jgi:parvulin-like peptidyl-prolyl isomerase